MGPALKAGIQYWCIYTRAYPHFSSYYNFYLRTFGTRLYNPYLGSPLVSERTIIEQTERLDATAVIEMYRGQ